VQLESVEPAHCATPELRLLDLYSVTQWWQLFLALYVNVHIKVHFCLVV
jgi:hypothetical protein